MPKPYSVRVIPTREADFPYPFQGLPQSNDVAPDQAMGSSDTTPGTIYNGRLAVRFGTINDSVPTIFGIPIGGDNPPTLEVTDNGVCYLKYTEMDSTPGKIYFDTNAPDDTKCFPDSGDASSSIVLFQVSNYNADTSTTPQIVTYDILPAVTHSLRHYCCSDTHFYWGV